MGLCELQIHASQVQTGTTSTSLAPDTSEATGMLPARDPRAIVLPNGALNTEIEDDMPIVSTLKGVGISLAVLPSEVLRLFQDGVIMELRAREQHAL